MKHIIEEEIKLSLDQTSYSELLMQISRSCNNAVFFTQENHFFDTRERLLRQQLMSVRLRRQNQAVFFTCKHRLPKQDIVHRQSEYEHQINHALWQAACEIGVPLNRIMPLPEPCSKLLAGADLEKIGQFFNQRWHFNDGKHQLCLDHTFFNKHIEEYELEIESEAIQEAAEKWLPLLAQWGFTQIPQTRSKLERCLTYAEQATAT